MNGKQNIKIKITHIILKFNSLNENKNIIIEINIRIGYSELYAKKSLLKIKSTEINNNTAKYL